MVKGSVEDMSGMGRPISLATAVMRTWGRTRNRVQKRFGPRSPYRIGDAVVGDDPFNGRREGVIVSRQGTSVGVETAHGVFFYDHRQLKQLD
ncbi:hypothetical protein [Pseudarthrobacter sp. NS4]|uniref:hypothetical protein n=1 Tax=Pseudarthrobacter sp. NS4 TaxID=2973976 RepID=UPI002162031E|nr:hypothetical protein [Pseudarthrobacter sp. NS4]